MMIMGSLFSGLGGFELAASLNGIIPLWASEIDATCVSVTRRHFPDLVHVGDITKLDGAKLTPVSVITGGFPCQDLSYAGRREGLSGDRSGLFFEMTRVIQEMLDATDNEYPRWIVAENVPGLVSSNKGEDFRIVMQELQNLGHGFVLDANILDAQNFGVPQRRRRVFIVCANTKWIERLPEYDYEDGLANADSSGQIGFGFGGDGDDNKQWLRACKYALERHIGNRRITEEVLPDIEGLRRHTSQSRSTGENTAAAYGRGAEVTDSMVGEPEDGVTARTTAGGNNVASTLVASYGTKWNGNAGAYHGDNFVLDPKKAVFPINTQVATRHKRDEVRDLGGVAGALQAQPGMKQTTFVIQGSMIGRDDKNGPQGSGISEDVCFTLNTTDRHAVAYSFDSLSSNSMKSANPNSGCREVDVAKTLDTSPPDPSKNQGGIAVVYVAKTDQTGSNGLGISEDVAYTLDGSAGQAVLASGKDTVGTLQANAGTMQWSGNQEAFSGDFHVVHGMLPDLRIRRLTVKECERLMGFPDNYTAYWHDGKEISDSKRYMMIGNSLAIPCVEFIMGNIADIERGVEA